ncbi:DUF4097 domain-containing protein [Ornithinimicrobium sp. F0845]|uniref:DUF4097 family beta strand repeat-containing protein n=1 Tax=Ornithinimicrobium sp. F0845 TaxID=2926412 RepID=UPI001FF2C2F2|nr:DUF4097 family beta strand repeat-containing protein [Ornithinimicrobium sp. F0845]MCK0110698.1 DUF4097 domain-containing protein [Ornithinimicrobium sp. F0845]
MTTTQNPPTTAPTPPRPPMAPSSRRLIVIIGGIVAVLIVLALAVPTASRLLESTERTSHALPADLSELTVDSDVGDVEIRAVGAGEQPGAQATLRSGLVDAQAEVAVDGGTATLTDTCQNRWWATCSVQWEILVPADTAVTVVSAVGEVTVENVTGPLSLTSSVGGLTATGLGSEQVTARSSVGDVTLELIADPVALQASSSTGDVTITVPGDATYRVVATASVGEVRNTLATDEASTRTIDVRTAVGDITLRRG